MQRQVRCTRVLVVVLVVAVLVSLLVLLILLQCGKGRTVQQFNGGVVVLMSLHTRSQSDHSFQPCVGVGAC